MEKPFTKYKIKKILIISISSLLGVALILSSTAYIIMRSYLSKINYVPLEEEVYTENDLGEEWEDEDYWDNEEYLEDIEALEGVEETAKVDPDAREGVDAQEYNKGNEPSSSEAFGNSSASINEEPSKTEAHEEDFRLEEPSIEAAIRENVNDTTKTIMKDKNVLNVLLIGTDNRKMGQRGLSDSMIIVSINSKSKRIIATSLLRDIYLYIPGKKNHNRLNTAYVSGGAKLLIETIEKNFKISIDKYASVDFYAFIHIVDQIGGITLEVTEDELPIVNNYIREINILQGDTREKDCLTSAGNQLLNGKQTLGYARVRYVGTDFGRTARQRKVLELIFQKMKQMKMSELGKLLNSILPEVTTNFTENELVAQVMKLPGYLDYELESWSIPEKGSYKNVTIRRMSVLGIDFDKNIEELYQKIYLTEP